jgi:hypothetical protein
MAPTARKRTYTGPSGVRLELDLDEVDADDPGAGTPVMVGYRNNWATYWCAMDGGCVEDDCGREIKIPLPALAWLQTSDIEAAVAMAIGDNGAPCLPE